MALSDARASKNKCLRNHFIGPTEAKQESSLPFLLSIIKIHTLVKHLLLFPHSLVIYWLEGIFTSLRVIHCTEEATSYLVIFHWIHKLQSSALSRVIPKQWI